MINEGDEAPSFKAPFVDEEIRERSFEADSTTVLAFFPGAFTEPCKDELCQIRDSMSDFNDLGVDLFGVSVDTPFSLDEFRKQNDLNFTLVSDSNKEIIESYGVEADFEDIGFYGLAQRAVFLIDDGKVVYSEVMDDPHNLPDLDELREQIEAL